MRLVHDCGFMLFGAANSQSMLQLNQLAGLISTFNYLPGSD
jgi:hypothetical protein